VRFHFNHHRWPQMLPLTIGLVGREKSDGRFSRALERGVISALQPSPLIDGSLVASSFASATAAFESASCHS
jgi:hypothetical protein